MIQPQLGVMTDLRFCRDNTSSILPMDDSLAELAFRQQGRLSQNRGAKTFTVPESFEDARSAQVIANAKM